MTRLGTTFHRYTFTSVLVPCTLETNTPISFRWKAVVPFVLGAVQTERGVQTERAVQTERSSTAGGPSFLFSCTKRHRISPCVGRPKSESTNECLPPK